MVCDNSRLNAATTGPSDHSTGNLLAKLCGKGRGPTVTEILAKTQLKEAINEPLYCNTAPFGWPPLMFACRNLNAEVISVLLENGANPNFRTKEGFTPMMAVVVTSTESNQDRSLECAKLLAGAGASIRHAHAFNKRTLLTRAVIKHSRSLVQFFVENNADLNKQDESGETPLNIAIQKKFMDIAEYLIEQGANPFDKNGNGESSLDLAMQSDSEGKGPNLEVLVTLWRTEYYDKHYSRRSKFRDMANQVNKPSPAPIDAPKKAKGNRRICNVKEEDPFQTKECDIPTLRPAPSGKSSAPRLTKAYSTQRVRNDRHDALREIANPFQLDLMLEEQDDGMSLDAEELTSVRGFSPNGSDFSTSSSPSDSPSPFVKSNETDVCNDESSELRFWLIMGTAVFAAAACIRYFGKHAPKH